MKKIITCSILLSGVIVLAGCSQPEAGKKQEPVSNLKIQPQTQIQTQPAPQPLSVNSNDTKTMELKIETTKPGTGDRQVKAGDVVFVQYTGKLTDGTKFDSTADHGGKPFSFTVGAGQVIKGWDQGLLGMKAGEKRTLTIPPNLGYGAAGAGNAIPPNATLIFDIELVSIQ